MVNDVLLFVAIGFAAQMVDGALGMAYGLTAMSVLLSFGTAPAVASASVHVAEVFTTAASGYAHWRVGNVDLGKVWRLAIPGMIGAFLGATALTRIPADAVRPLVAAYLLISGAIVLYRGLASANWKTEPRRDMGDGKLLLPVLGFCGGFLDALGGGWGAMITSALMWKGALPRMAIGTVSASEFFVTVTASATFYFAVGVDLWPIVLGLIIGGVLAAPLAATVVRYMPDRPLMILVGALIVLLALRQLATALK